MRDNILVFTRNPAIVGRSLVINKRFVAGRRIVANICLIAVVTWTWDSAINRVVYSPVGDSRVTIAIGPNADGKGPRCYWEFEWLEKWRKGARVGESFCMWVFAINMRRPRSGKHSW